ncbi:MAG: hypothetical protein ACT4NY_30890 [Pseudonocardiales bacterium]
MTAGQRHSAAVPQRVVHSGPGRARRGYADDGITHLTARFGYMETPDVPGALRAAQEGTGVVVPVWVNGGLGGGEPAGTGRAAVQRRTTRWPRDWREIYAQASSKATRAALKRLEHCVQRMSRV